MPRSNRPRDTNQIAEHIVDLATGGQDNPVAEPVNQFAQAGGRKGGRARPRKLSQEERRHIAAKAARTLA